MRPTNLIFKTLIVTLLLLFIVITGCFASIILYNNQDSIELTATKIEIDTLKSTINDLENLKSIEGEYLIGRVIERDLYNFYNEVVINLGTKDGVNENDAVINEQGLIGIIVKTTSNYSYVKLLTSDYNVSVRINDTYGNLNRGVVSLLDKYSDINTGDKVYTSGYSGLTKDIYIGTITKVQFDKENLGKEVSVALIDNKNLNYIAVIRSSK